MEEQLRLQRHSVVLQAVTPERALRRLAVPECVPACHASFASQGAYDCVQGLESRQA